MYTLKTYGGLTTILPPLLTLTFLLIHYPLPLFFLVDNFFSIANQETWFGGEGSPSRLGGEGRKNSAFLRPQTMRGRRKAE